MKIACNRQFIAALFLCCIRDAVVLGGGGVVAESLFWAKTETVHPNRQNVFLGAMPSDFSPLFDV